MAKIATRAKTEPHKETLPRHLKRSKGKLYFRTKTKYLGAVPELTDAGFMAAYLAKCELAGVPVPDQFAAFAPPAPDAPAPLVYLPGSIGWFIDKYMDPEESPDWREFADSTRYNYTKGLEQIRAELGGGQLADLNCENLDVYFAGQARKSTARAEVHRNLLSNLWEFAKGFAEFQRNGKSNPTWDTKKHYKVRVRGKVKGHKKWSPELERTVLAAAKPRTQLLVYLLRETGQRLGDVCNMLWSDYDGARIYVAGTEKTDEPVRVYASLRLRAILDATPRYGRYIFSKRSGKPYRKGTLSHMIGRLLTKLGVPRGTGVSGHGLRKTLASEMAEGGATVSAIKNQLGQRSAAMALFYCDQAEKEPLAVQAGEAIERARQQALAREATAGVGALGGDIVLDMRSLLAVPATVSTAVSTGRLAGGKKVETLIENTEEFGVFHNRCKNTAVAKKS
jgi:site-specific recombinase XerD